MGNQLSVNREQGSGQRARFPRHRSRVAGSREKRAEGLQGQRGRGSNSKFKIHAFKIPYTPHPFFTSHQPLATLPTPDSRFSKICHTKNIQIERD
ncbi:hypothetical protein [Chroococcidiopsis sp.]|uniref:hypothetical protein n=1 Tax=Chroococcidiopsis sp. TaxID=3088168 RepID=UPI003F30D3BE